MRRETPNEKSVVQALRDWQWKRIDPVSQPRPDLNVQLSGRPETRLGDVIIQQGERLYLIEAKATQAQICDEWLYRPKNQPKSAYSRLQDMVIALGKYEHTQAFDQITAKPLMQSLACHHFAFWPTDNVISADVDEPWIDPYLLAIVKKGGFSHVDAAQGLRVLDHYKLAASLDPIEQPDHLAISFELVSFATMDLVHQRIARIVGRDPNEAEEYAWGHVGLELDAFQEYVNWLCHGKSETTCVVVMSSLGSVFDVILDTANLAAFVKAYRQGSQKPARRPGRPPDLVPQIFTARSTYPSSTAGVKATLPDP